MKKNFKKLLATIFATTNLCSSACYCMEKKNTTLYWPSYLYPFPNGVFLTNQALQTSNALLSLFPKTVPEFDPNGNPKPWDPVKLNPNVTKLFKDSKIGDIVNGYDQLLEDAKNGGYNVCMFKSCAVLNEEYMQPKGGFGFRISVNGHMVACFITKDGNIWVWNPQYLSTQWHPHCAWVKLDQFVENIHNNFYKPVQTGKMVVEPLSYGFSDTGTGMSLVLFLRMMAMLRLNAYMVDKNDKQSLQDAKNLVKNISDLEQKPYIECWPAFYLTHFYESKDTIIANSIFIPPFENLKKLFDDGKYDEYLKSELPYNLFKAFYDWSSLKQTEKKETIKDLIKHLSLQNHNSFLCFMRTLKNGTNDDIKKYIADINIKKYSDFYRTYNKDLTKCKNDESLCNGLELDCDFVDIMFNNNGYVCMLQLGDPQTAFARYGNHPFECNKKINNLRTKFEKKKTLANQRNFEDEIQKHNLSKILNRANSDGHKMYLENEINGLNSQIEYRHSKVYNPDIDSI